MQYANNNEGERIEAMPNSRGICPACGSEVIAKCGAIKVWHWAHKSADCDPWYEGMTQWHIDWQNEFPAEYREVVIRRGDEVHRADIALPDGTIIEFQHSPISVDEIARREQFYGSKMIWVFDGVDAVKKNRFAWRKKGNYYTFRWKHAKTTVGDTNRKTYIDLGIGYLFDLRKMYTAAPVSGWGHLQALENFVDEPQKATFTTADDLNPFSWKDIYRRAVQKALSALRMYPDDYVSDDDFINAIYMARFLHEAHAPYAVIIDTVEKYSKEVGMSLLDTPHVIYKLAVKEQMPKDKMLEWWRGSN